MLANAFPTGVPEGLADSFVDLVFEVRIEQDWIGDWEDGSVLARPLSTPQ